MFSREDLAQIKKHGPALADVIKQLDCFRRGMSPVRLVRPCRVGDGIIRLPERIFPELLALQAEAVARGRFGKFVPASGAASRMFEKWQRLAYEGHRERGQEAEIWLKNLSRYPFYEDLRQAALQEGLTEASWLQEENMPRLMQLLLDNRGLGLAGRPKALIKFHRYADGSRTALEEQLWEATAYLADGGGRCRCHFTLPAKGYEEIEEVTWKTGREIKSKSGLEMVVDFSCQDPRTDTIAADQAGLPFRDSAGRLVFRPGGHGSLLGNLEATGGDIVYIKNIDNVAREEQIAATIRYKKLLGGFFLFQERRIAALLAGLEGHGWEAMVLPAREYVENILGIRWEESFADARPSPQREELIRILSRPLRVCGVVPNQGEPGGGPFFVAGDRPHAESPQIVEGAQVDPLNPAQAACWSQATHFNPVDLVCSLRNHRGEPFSLKQYVDEMAFLIAKKTHEGRDLWALERPGLWNGAMAFWNSIFVEVPLSTFNPVKTVDDLLRPEHLGADMKRVC
jgi:hypothetical protein